MTVKMPMFARPFVSGAIARAMPRAAPAGRIAEPGCPDGPHIGDLFALNERPPCTSVAFDIVGFGERCRDDEVQIFVHRSLYGMLKQAFDEVGISWPATHHEDRGDGALILVPAGTSPAVLVGPLVAELARCLRQYNKLVADAAQIRLRMAVHSGPIFQDANGLVGSCLVHLFRMLEAPEFKRLVAGSGTDLGVVASERIYRDVIEPAATFPGIGVFQPIEVVLKETRTSAWVYLSDDPRAAALSDLLSA